MSKPTLIFSALAVAVLFGGIALMPLSPQLADSLTNQLAAVYTSTGTQTYTVPAGVSQIHVDMWGGGGIQFQGGNIGSCEGYYVNSQSNGAGGGGGYTGADIPVTPGQVLTLVVGAADGGGAGSGNGGGYTGIFSGSASQANALMVAGGGGGSGGNIHIYAAATTCSYPNAGALPPGGLGGGTIGGSVLPHGGSGGTQTAGGTGSSPGGALTGGAGSSFGGGGGAGYWGGGGSGGSGYYGGSGGGGGSGYCKSTLLNCSVIGASTQGVAANSSSAPTNAGNSNNPGAIVITETAAPSQPTVTITGNGTSPATVQSGQPVTILATFTAAPSDALVQTAINDYQQNDLTGAFTPPGDRSYTFNTAANPADPGDYIFYPAVQTQSYPAWNNYNKSLTITVTAAPAGCQNGNGPANACTSCSAGFTLSGGVCVPNACAGGQTNPPTCTLCPAGQHNDASNTCVNDTCPGGQTNPPVCTVCPFGQQNDSNNVCVDITCPDPHAVAPLCTCEVGYQTSGGVCAPVPPSLSLSATPSRVHTGQTAAVSWSVNGLTANSGQSCTITSNPSSAFSRTMPLNTAPTWSGSSQSAAITGPVTITLSCTGAGSKSVSIGLLPVFQEI